MKISNARVYRNGRFERSSVEFSDKISAFDVEGGVDAHGAYLVPGFIDIHRHAAAAPTRYPHSRATTPRTA